MKFDRGVGFSNGWGSIGVHKSAAVGSQHFNRHLRRHRSLGDGLRIDRLLFHHRITLSVIHWVPIRVLLLHLDLLCLNHLSGLIGLEVLWNSLPDQEQGIEKANW